MLDFAPVCVFVIGRSGSAGHSEVAGTGEAMPGKVAPRAKVAAGAAKATTPPAQPRPESVHEESVPPAWIGREIDGFEIMDQVGAGAFSQVHLCQHKETGAYAAVKIVSLEKRSEQELHTIVREVSVFMNVSHPNIVSLYHMSTVENSLFFFMEFVTNGTLLDHVTKKKKLKEDEARIYFVQMFDAIRHLHMYHFLVHRDLKLENVLMGERGKVKIADFGLAGTAYNNIMRTFAGTTGFQAPEVFQSEYSEKADVWSLGVCLWAMLTGVLPYGEPTTLSMLLDRIHECRWPPESVFSKNVSDLLKRLLTVNAAERPSLMELQTHPWLHGLKPLGANIMPNPVTFYYMKTPGPEALRQYKRVAVPPDPAVVEKCAERGVDAGKLRSDLAAGECSKETTIYFLLKTPLMNRPVIGPAAGPSPAGAGAPRSPVGKRPPPPTGPSAAAVRRPPGYSRSASNPAVGTPPRFAGKK